MLNKAKLNFFVDAIILVAFIAVALASVILVAMPHEGFRGGRNPAYYETVLFLTRSDWNDIHVWAGLALMVGIVVHVVLHWRWIVRMLRGFVRGGRSAPPWPGETEPCLAVVTDGEN